MRRQPNRLYFAMPSEKTERKHLARLLDLLAEISQMIAIDPTTVPKRESPDFLVRDGVRRIGIEITNSFPEEQARAHHVLKDQVIEIGRAHV